MDPLVTVTIVTHNSRRFIEKCLASVYRQRCESFEVVILDNSSTDGTAELLSRHEESARVIYRQDNTGFAAGQNEAVRAARGKWILTLNPDVVLEASFLTQMLQAGNRHPGIGVVCGRLLRATPELGIPLSPRIDSTGIYFTPSLRHLDRGWNEPDDGRYRQTEFVFGASAASALYRRSMIDDVSVGGDFFDPEFFAYREDADVAWRAQLLGWRCLYLPEAVGYHVRRVVPGYRGQVPRLLRMHSVKNRFLMRIKNMTGDLYQRQFFSVMWRDLMVVGGCLIQERSSLPAFWRTLALLRRTLAQRREIMSRRRVSDAYLASWFLDQPTSKPLDALASELGRARRPGEPSLARLSSSPSAPLGLMEP